MSVFRMAEVSNDISNRRGRRYCTENSGNTISSLNIPGTLFIGDFYRTDKCVQIVYGIRYT